MVAKLNLLGFILMSCLFCLMQAADPDPNQDQPPNPPNRNGLHIEEQQMIVLFTDLFARVLVGDEEVRDQLSNFVHEALSFGWIRRDEGASVSDLYYCLLSDSTEAKAVHAKQQETLDTVVIDIKQLLESSQKSEGKLDRLLKHFEQAEVGKVKQEDRFSAILQELIQLQESDAQQKDDLKAGVDVLRNGAESLSLVRESIQLIGKNQIAIMDLALAQQGSLEGLEQQVTQLGIKLLSLMGEFIQPIGKNQKVIMDQVLAQKDGLEGLEQQVAQLGIKFSEGQKEGGDGVKELQQGYDKQKQRLDLIEGEVATVKGRLEHLPNGVVTPDPSAV